MKERRENKNERKKRKNKWEKIDRNRQKKKKTNIMKLNKILRNRERNVNNRERKKRKKYKRKSRQNSLNDETDVARVKMSSHNLLFFTFWSKHRKTDRSLIKTKDPFTKRKEKEGLSHFLLLFLRLERLCNVWTRFSLLRYCFWNLLERSEIFFLLFRVSATSSKNRFLVWKRPKKIQPRLVRVGRVVNIKKLLF